MKKSFIPPYISAGEFIKFINSARNRRPDPLTLKTLGEIGVSKSNSYTLFGTLKAMGLYDEKGTLLQRDDLSGLASRDEDIRRESFRRILDRTYHDLMEAIPVEEATVEKVRHFFVVNGAAPSPALKGARLFIWLAIQAGFETAEEEFTPYNLEQNKGQKPKAASKEVRRTRLNGSSKGGSSKPALPYEASPSDYEERLLNILLDKISSTKELPSTEILKQVRELIDLQKERSKSQQATQATLPLMGNENENA